MFKINVTGLGDMKASFASMTADLPRIVDGELQAAAQEWVKLAKQAAPADQAALVSAITYFKSKNGYTVAAQKFYAPFVEFGTKGKYKPIPGTEQIAAQFKGYRGGDFIDLLRAILRWVKRKGITGTYSVKTRRRTGNKLDRAAEDWSAAWPIALSIVKNGISPHPFFFKNMHIVWPRFVRNVEAAIARRSKVKVTMPSNTQPTIMTV